MLSERVEENMKEPYYTFLTSQDSIGFEIHKYLQFKTEKELREKWEELKRNYSGYVDSKGNEKFLMEHWKLVKILDLEKEEKI